MGTQVPVGPVMMKKISGLLSLAAVAGLVVWLSVLQGRLTRSEQARRQLQAAQEQLVAQHRQAAHEIEALRQQLSRERADGADPAGPRTRTGPCGGESRAGAGTPLHPSGDATLSGKDSAQGYPLPAAVHASLVQRFGAFEIREVQPSLLDGKPAYLVRGITSDGRSLGAMVTPDGEVLTSKSELSAEALPEPVAAALRELGGSTTIEKAREIYAPGGVLEYAVTGQSEDGRKVSLNISAEGRITGGEVERAANDLPDLVRDTVTQTVADRSPSSVVQVLGSKGVLYEVAFGGDSERTHLVIDDRGRLVSYASKAAFPPDPLEEQPKP